MPKRFLVVAILTSFSFMGCHSIKGSLNQQSLSASLQSDGVVVKVNDVVFTKYLISDTQKYPYFYPVNGPASELSVTTETSEPYPHHHSLFFACDHVNDGNYWQDVLERGKIVSRDIEIIESKGPQVVFRNSCEWIRPDAPAPFCDERVITVSAPSPGLRVIDFEITLTALMDVQITKTNHSLFSARMVPELSVKQGGVIINAHGDTTEKGTWGKESPWIDYWGDRNGIVEGLAIFAHPDNGCFPPKWFTRDYGFFSPTNMYWLDEDGLNFSKGEQAHLKYRVVVHQGDTEIANIASLYEKWVN